MLYHAICFLKRSLNLNCVSRCGESNDGLYVGKTIAEESVK